MEEARAPLPEPQAPQRDVVDVQLEAWKREFPDMDVLTEALISRIMKISRYVERALRETADAYGLTLQDWDVLSALRRAGTPYRLSPSQLAKDLMVHPATMTGRIDKLEAAGWVRRLADPQDRRATQVELTPRGKSKWEEAVQLQARKEQLIAGSLSPEEKLTASDLLRRVMVSFEGLYGPPPTKSQIADQR
jgi:DNA-binding MarR family transcriptional regulator